MRFMEIDGKKYDVPGCWACPCYSEGNDYDRYEECRHPVGAVCATGGGRDGKGEEVYGHSCPLRTKPELAEGGVIDPSKAGDVYLDPPGSNEDREIVIPEWVHIHLEKEILGCLIAFCMPRLIEDIAKLEPKEQAQIVKNLEGMRRIARMKPEERLLCTMDQEEAIKRGIEACTVKGAKE